ncbi:alpha/beta fold hydrolase [Ulvibacterium sp.]|uniref:alpha/beta fold hydrolase n=1 Tax=Ulvibacterium sp. TaxID=2665914 RepID=UPI003BABD0AC
MSSSIYKSENTRCQLLKLYDQKQQNLKIPIEDVYVDTFAGKTHVLASGDSKNPPVVLLHAFNAGAPVSLEPIQGLQRNYRLYALDTIGQATKSAETRLSLGNEDYGKWVSEVVSKLKVEEATFIGVSYGAFILLNYLKFSPEKIGKCIFLVPAGIANGNTITLLRKVTFPIINFLITKSEKSLRRFMDAFYTTYDNDDVSFLRHILLGMKHDHRKPPLVKKSELEHFSAPTYVMVVDDDVFFPADKVVMRSKSIFKNFKEWYMLKGSKHIPDSRFYNEIEKVLTTWLQA